MVNNNTDLGRIEYTLKGPFADGAICKQRKRKMETESGNGMRKWKRKAEKGKGRHCDTYNVIVQAS